MFCTTAMPRRGVSRLVLATCIFGFSTGGFASPWPADPMTPLYEQAARYVLSQVEGPKTGYCLVFGAGQGGGGQFVGRCRGAARVVAKLRPVASPHRSRPKAGNDC